MELDKIKTIINNGELFIYAGNKKTTKKELYNLYHLDFKSNLKKEFKNKHIEFIYSKSNLPVVNYNPVVKQNDCIENITCGKVNGLKDLYKKFSNIDPSSSMNYKSINFFIFKYVYEESEILLFRRHFHSNKLDRSFKVMPVSGIYDQITENKFLTIDADIDLLILNNDIHIFDHISIERIFVMLEEFQDKANSTLDKIATFNNFDDFEKIRESILSNGRLVRRVAKLSEDPGRSTLFLEDIEKTIEVIKNLKLNINIESKTKKFMFTDDSELNELINLMQDSYYKTLIGKRSGTDEVN
ncbi:DUF4868 domain-containing protein [Staphylococcus saprophyticus]|uniref:Kiwa anti-phage protein KwaB-like domain-containing protein n=1 Tax=Staphylococcus TaxID=1279 RepID=UPI001933B0C0|nr:MULTISPECIES: Kiwa anti-phage protein KwaB-like domain-containing protein [Staphylococcus]MBM0845959.1 DUF4868 domain-containing protein [Staphylococcus saprophyticus]MCA2501249.1 DUF4868 domain-containing protein [Staphylococcus xylosus]